MLFSSCRRGRSLPVLLVATLLLAAGPARAGNWPGWRGPTGDSVSRETRLPVTWSEQENLAWKAPLPEWGNSTPAIWDDAVFLTAEHDNRLLLLRIDKATGARIWTRQVGTGTAYRKGRPGTRKAQFHQLHNLASPSPATDGEHVVVHFGNGDFACYDVDGNRIWKRNLADDYGRYTIWWGYGSSPVLYGDWVITVCMQDSLADLDLEPATSYVVAHEVRTGREAWKTLRMTGAQAESCDSYTTPVLHQRGSQDELIVMGGNQLDAYDPATGKPLWWLPGLEGGRTITGPTLAGGMVFTTVGMRGPLHAVELGGTGRLSDQDAIRWRASQSTPDTCCPVVWNDLLLTVSDNGIAVCRDAGTGELYWQERLAGGDYKSSPLAAEGRFYCVDRSGVTTVLAASKKFQKLAENRLDDEFIASPAVSEGRLYLRGRKSLYAIGRE